MIHTRICISLLIITSFIYSNKDCCYYAACEGFKTNISSKQSEFSYNNNTYKLIVNSTEEVYDFHISQYLTLSYEVYKNGELINNIEKKGNIIEGGCDHIGGRDYTIDLLNKDGNIGWILHSPKYCGASSSGALATIIVPSKQNDNYTSKQVEIAGVLSEIKYEHHEKGIDFYYAKQDYGLSGTWSSIYVPYKFTYNINKNIFHPADMHIEDIKYIDPYFLGIFMRGFYSKDKELMQYALDYYYDKEDLNWYEGYFGCSYTDISEKIEYETYLKLNDCSRSGIQNAIFTLK